MDFPSRKLDIIPILAGLPRFLYGSGMQQMPRMIGFLGLCVLVSCGSLGRQKPQEVVNLGPKPQLWHDGLYHLTAPMGKERLLTVVPVELAPLPAGYRWSLQLMTPKNAQNGTQIVARSSQGKLCYLDQAAPVDDSLFPSEEEVTASAEQKKSAPKAGLEASMEAEPGRFDVELSVRASQITKLNQRVSLVAIAVPSTQ